MGVWVCIKRMDKNEDTHTGLRELFRLEPVSLVMKEVKLKL